MPIGNISNLSEAKIYRVDESPHLDKSLNVDISSYDDSIFVFDDRYMDSAIADPFDILAPQVSDAPFGAIHEMKAQFMHEVQFTAKPIHAEGNS